MPSSLQPDNFILNCRGVKLDCRPLPAGGGQIMGILNVTPDSFSDGGLFVGIDGALQQAERMIAEGATIVDVGGESSRPKGSTYGAGARPVEADEEMRRVIPVISAIAERFPRTVISVDTYKAVVAERAIEAGATMINDITGLRQDPRIADVASRHQIPLVLMHSVGLPGDMPHEKLSGDLISDVAVALKRAVDVATGRGANQIVIDPGFGFGKTVAENMKLIARVGTFLALNRPLMVGISRKSSIGAILGTKDHPVPIPERLFGSLGATAVAVLRGASIIRTHDVRPTFEMLKLITAITAQDERSEGCV